MMLSTLFYQPVFCSIPLLNVYCIIIKQLTLMILKKFCLMFLGDVIDFENDNIEIPWSQWKDLFSLL